jgi:putative flippase GtrA
MNKKQEFWRIVRFGITGSLSTLLHYGAYLLALLWVNPTVAYTAGYGVGLCFNYVMTTFFTFREHPTKKNAAGFVASHMVNYLLEIGVLNAFLYFGMEERLAGIVTLVVVVPVNFLLLRFVFVGKH